jgi:hypothetical protein
MGIIVGIVVIVGGGGRRTIGGGGGGGEGVKLVRDEEQTLEIRLGSRIVAWMSKGGCRYCGGVVVVVVVMVAIRCFDWMGEDASLPHPPETIPENGGKVSWCRVCRIRT